MEPEMKFPIQQELSLIIWTKKGSKNFFFLDRLALVQALFLSRYDLIPFVDASGSITILAMYLRNWLCLRDCTSTFYHMIISTVYFKQRSSSSFQSYSYVS
jgi:hypothetical protein